VDPFLNCSTAHAFPFGAQSIRHAEFRPVGLAYVSVRTANLSVDDALCGADFPDFSPHNRIVKKWATCPTAASLDLALAPILPRSRTVRLLKSRKTVPAAYAREDDGKHSSSPPCDGFLLRQAGRFFDILGGSTCRPAPKPQMQAQGRCLITAPSLTPPRICCPGGGMVRRIGERRTLDQAHEGHPAGRSCLISILCGLGCALQNCAFCAKNGG